MAEEASAWDDLVKYLHGAEQLFRPGTVFDTQRIDSIVLANVSARVAGRGFVPFAREVLRDVVGANLLAARDTCRRGVKKTPTEDVAVWSEIGPDLELRLADLVNIGEFIGEKSSGASAGQSMIDDMVVTFPGEINELPIDRLPTAFGLGVARYSRGFAGAEGASGHECFCIRVSRSRDAIVAVSIKSPNLVTRNRIVEAIYEALGVEPLMPAVHTDAYREIDLALFEGVYHGVGRRIIASSVSGNGLKLRVLANQGAEVEIHLSRTREMSLDILPRHLSLSLFRDPDDGGPAIMLGQNAYKRTCNEGPRAL
jgi:hypothetical protein